MQEWLWIVAGAVVGLVALDLLWCLAQQMEAKDNARHLRRMNMHEAAEVLEAYSDGKKTNSLLGVFTGKPP
jgi:hypothetical protein